VRSYAISIFAHREALKTICFRAKHIRHDADNRDTTAEGELVVVHDFQRLRGYMVNEGAQGAKLLDIKPLGSNIYWETSCGN
jgi:hypothetical protein